MERKVEKAEDEELDHGTHAGCRAFGQDTTETEIFRTGVRMCLVKRESRVEDDTFTVEKPSTDEY